MNYLIWVKIYCTISQSLISYRKRDHLHLFPLLCGHIFLLPLRLSFHIAVTRFFSGLTFFHQLGLAIFASKACFWWWDCTLLTFNKCLGRVLNIARHLAAHCTWGIFAEISRVILKSNWYHRLFFWISWLQTGYSCVRVKSKIGAVHSSSCCWLQVFDKLDSGWFPSYLIIYYFLHFYGILKPQ